MKARDELLPEHDVSREALPGPQETTVKSPNFDRVFMKKNFYSIFLLGEPI
jgi:hypothetical protein